MYGELPARVAGTVAQLWAVRVSGSSAERANQRHHFQHFDSGLGYRIQELSGPLETCSALSTEAYRIFCGCNPPNAAIV